MQETLDRHKSIIDSFFQLSAKNPDEYFRDLHRILLPIQGEPFENEAISVARLIARKFGSVVTMLHIGPKNLSEIQQAFTQANAKFETCMIEQGEPHKVILNELETQDYQLLIMPSRRRPRLRQRLSFNSISAKVIPESNCDVLQIFHRHPDNHDDTGFKIHQFQRIATLLPGSIRDLDLLYYANAMLTSRNSSMQSYYFAKLPYITPAHEATQSTAYDAEKDTFQTIIDAYSMFFGTRINGEFVVTRNLDRGAANFLNREQKRPDIVFFGQTKHRKWNELRTLSDKFIDRILPAVAVHHYSGRKKQFITQKK